MRVKETRKSGKWSLENVAECCVGDDVEDGADLGCEQGC